MNPGSTTGEVTAGPVARARPGRVIVPSVAPADIDLRHAVRPGDALLIPQGAGEPLTLTTALVAQSGGLGGISAFLGLCHNPALAGATGIRWRSYGWLGVVAGLRPEVPSMHMSALPGLIRSGRVPVDVLLCQASPADADGYHHVGPSVDYVMAALEVARVVIAEINPRVPVVAGAGRVHGSRFTRTVPADHPLIQAPDPPPAVVDTAIAERVAALAADGITLQLGVGSIAAAVARGLRGHRDVRVHSGMVGDWLVDLAEAGALADADAGPVVVSGTALGTDRLYRFLHGNPAVELRTVDQVHAAAAMAGIPRLLAVNGALQVDLTGQVNAESLDGRPVGATGGQVDFLRAAAVSPGGLGVIALPATAARGTVSRIVPRLDGPITTGRADAQWVVTEHGVADLRGLGDHQRAEALAAIAAPEFRAALLTAAADGPGG